MIITQKQSLRICSTVKVSWVRICSRNASYTITVVEMTVFSRKKHYVSVSILRDFCIIIVSLKSYVVPIY